MREVPLASIPNQAFTATVGGARWGLRLFTATGVMACDITRQDVVLVRGARVLAGEPLIPYAYLQTGNFLLTSLAGDMPDFQKFGVSQFLVYLSADEIADLNIDPPTYETLMPFEPSYLTDDSGFYITTDTGKVLTDD